MTIKTLWFANWSAINNRTVETKAFSRLADAKRALDGRYGYVIRQDEASRVAYMTPGFNPTAGEQAKIDSIIGKEEN